MPCPEPAAGTTGSCVGPKWPEPKPKPEGPLGGGDPGAARELAPETWRVPGRRAPVLRVALGVASGAGPGRGEPLTCRRGVPDTVGSCTPPLRRCDPRGAEAALA